MTISISKLISLTSAQQEINLYNWNYDGLLSNSIDATVTKLHNLEDSIELLSSFTIEDFQTTRGRVQSLNGANMLVCSAEIDDFAPIASMSSVFSPPFVVNYRETVSYVVLDGISTAMIDIPYEIRFLGQRLLSDSKTVVANTDLGGLITVEDAIYDSILTDAIDAKNIGYKQLFMPVVGKSNTQYSVSMIIEDMFDFPDDNGKVEHKSYIDYITILPIIFSDTFGNLVETFRAEILPYEQEDAVTLDLEDYRSSNMSLLSLPILQDVYSELIYFTSHGITLEPAIMSLTSVPSKDSFEPMLSNELSMVNIRRSSVSSTHIPLMTGQEDQGYKITTNYPIYSSYYPFRAFNQSVNYPAIFTTQQGDFIIDLPSTSIMHSYSVGIGTGYYDHNDAPSDWTLFGVTNDGIERELDKVSLGRQMNKGEVISRALDRPFEYRSYRLYVHHIGQLGGWTRIGLLDFIFNDKSYDYKIVDLSPYYSLPWEPVAKIYEPGDYISLDGFTYAIASWNDFKDFNGITKEVGRFSISSVDPVSLNGLLLDYIEFSMTDVPDDIVDLGSFVSPYMIIQAGIKSGINKDGIYKGIYLDTHQKRVNSNTPWLQNNGSIVRISDSKFYDMSFENSEISVYKLSDSMFNTTLLEWERIYIDGSNWNIPEYRLSPYIRIDSASGDFVIIALSVTGGSITHMHRDGFLDSYGYGDAFNIDDDKLLKLSNKTYAEETVDPYKAEAYAKAVSNSRYRKSAKIIKDTIDGLIYDQYVIDDAFDLISRFEYAALFFDDINCNPIVLNSIMKDKLSGMTNKEIFSHTGTYEFNDVSFIYYDDDAIESSNSILSYVKSHSNILLDDYKYPLSVFFTNVTPGNMILENIIDNCGSNSLCSNAIVNGFKSLGGIAVGELGITLSDTNPNHLLFTGEETFVREILSEYGIIDTYPILFEDFVELSLPKKYLSITSPESRLVATIGTEYDGLIYEGRLTIGLKSLDGIQGGYSNFVASIPNEVFNEVYSDFEFNLHIVTRNDNLRPYVKPGGLITIDEDFLSLDDFFDRVPSIWMKMFFPSPAGRSDISAPIMRFNITDRYFAKNFNIPYIYVDDPFIDPQYRTFKSGNSDIMEKKLKDVEDLGRDETKEKRSDLVCGEERTMTYLDFQAFDHKFSATNNRAFGNYTWEMKELLMSGYIRISTNQIIAPGKKLSDIDALEKTLYEVRLSFIDDLDVVADWHIEEFQLDAVDFGLSADNSELLMDIDDKFRGLLKAVTATLGDDIISYQQREEVNAFPAFPDRPSSANSFATMKVQQYFIVEEIPNV